MGTRAGVALVIGLGVVVGGAAWADGVARSGAEDDLARTLLTQVDGLETEPDVVIEGVPFLTQVAAGQLESVRISADSVTVQGLPLHDVVVHLEGVRTDGPTTARTATLAGSARTADLGGLLSFDADLAVEDGRLVASTTVLGLPVSVRVVPRADGRAVAADVESISLAGAVVDAADLPGPLADRVQGVSVPLDGLPPGLELTEVTVTPTGLDLAAAGTDVTLPAAAAG